MDSDSDLDDKSAYDGVEIDDLEDACPSEEEVDDDDVQNTNVHEDTNMETSEENDGTAEGKRSRPSTKLQAATHLLEISSRIENVISELKQITAILSNDNHKDASKRAEARTILEKSITPFLTLASAGINDSVVTLTPIQGADRVHSRQNVEWKRKVLDACDEHDNRRPPLKFIDAFVDSCYLNNEEFWAKKTRKKTPKPKKTKPPQIQVPTPAIQAEPDSNQPIDPANTIYGKVTALQRIPLTSMEHMLSADGKSQIAPPPLNGVQYTKIEVLAIITRCTAQQRTVAIKGMIAQKLVPCGRAKVSLEK